MRFPERGQARARNDTFAHQKETTSTLQVALRDFTKPPLEEAGRNCSPPGSTLWSYPVAIVSMWLSCYCLDDFAECRLRGCAGNLRN
jgi:hypothetical protein